jgi:hypothetical protein
MSFFLLSDDRKAEPWARVLAVLLDGLSKTTCFGGGLQLVQLAKESGSDSGISIQDCCSRLRQYSEAQIRYSPHAEELTMILRVSDRDACPFPS